MNLTQEQIAHRLGVSRNYVWMLEKGTKEGGHSLLYKLKRLEIEAGVAPVPMDYGGARTALRSAREGAGISLSDLSKRTKIPIYTLQNLENGSAHIKEDSARKIAKVIPTLNYDDLLAGSEVPVILDESAATGTLGAVPDLQLPPGVTAKFVPKLSYAQAGALHAWDDDLYEHEGVLAMNVPPRAKAFALEIRGDSMEEQIHEGDNVIIQWGETPRNGEIVVACLQNGEVMCKIYNVSREKVVLSSYNPSHQPIPLQEDEIRWVYPVIGMHRNFRR